MQTTSREIGEKLKANGWVKETAFKWVYIEEDDRWDLVYAPGIHFNKNRPEFQDQVLPAPIVDEIAEEVSLEDLVKHWRVGFKYGKDHFDVWLYTTMRSADALAEVWIAKQKAKQ